MDILIKSLVNPISLFVFDYSQNITSQLIFYLTCAVLFIIFIFMLKRKKYIFSFFYFLLLSVILLTFSYLYKRGCKINDIRDNGYVLLHNIEKFKTLNKRFPHDIEEIYSFMSSKGDSNLQKLSKTRNYYNNKYDTLNRGNSYKFSLTICDDLLGFDCFIFYDNPIRFELTDD